jgi:Flp pilus assembly pilin Flp
MESPAEEVGRNMAWLLATLYAHLDRTSDRISNEHGATAAEYALFLAAIAAIIAAAVQAIGISLNAIFVNFVASI